MTKKAGGVANLERIILGVDCDDSNLLVCNSIFFKNTETDHKICIGSVANERIILNPESHRLARSKLTVLQAIQNVRAAMQTPEVSD